MVAFVVVLYDDFVVVVGIVIIVVLLSCKLSVAVILHFRRTVVVSTPTAPNPNTTPSRPVSIVCFERSVLRKVKR